MHDMKHALGWFSHHSGASIAIAITANDMATNTTGIMGVVSQGHPGLLRHQTAPFGVKQAVQAVHTVPRQLVFGRVGIGLKRCCLVSLGVIGVRSDDGTWQSDPAMQPIQVSAIAGKFSMDRLDIAAPTFIGCSLDG